MICLRTMAHAGSIIALPPTTRWRCRPIMRTHLHGRLDCLNRQHPMAQTSWVNCRCRRRCSCSLRCHLRFPQFLSALACCWPKSPLITNEGARCHWWPLWCLWHECVLQILRATQIGGWHPHPCPLGSQCHCFPLATPCPLETWGGNIPRRLSQLCCQKGHLDLVTQQARLTPHAGSIQRPLPIGLLAPEPMRYLTTGMPPQVPTSSLSAGSRMLALRTLCTSL
jgi:hypothetical protein